MGFRKKIIIGLAALLLLTGLFFYLTSGLNNQNTVDTYIPEGAEIEPGELIINFQEGFAPNDKNFSKIEAKLKAVGVVSWEKIYRSEQKPLKNYYLVKFKAGLSLVDSQRELEKIEGIRVADANYTFELDKAPNDTLFKSQKQWNLTKVQMEQAWDKHTGEGKVLVAVVDSGIDYNHEDFNKDKIQTISDQDQNDYEIYPSLDQLGHGSHVAGIIGASTNNQKGIAGINWNIKLLAVNLTGEEERLSLATTLRGIELSMDKGAKIINLSLGSVRANKGCREVEPLHNLIRELNKKGIIVVTSAGNRNTDMAQTIPASCEGVLAVAAINPDDRENPEDIRGGCFKKDAYKSCFSNYGDGVKLAAPGVAVLSIKAENCNFCKESSVVEGKYVYLSGTSMAAPHVSAAAALVWSANPKLSSQQVKDCLVNNADEFETKPDKPIGKRLNVSKALADCATSPGPQNPQAGSPGALSPLPNPQQEGGDEFPKTASITVPVCAKPGQSVQVNTKAEARNTDFPLIGLSAHFRRKNLPENGQDRTGKSWTQIFRVSTNQDLQTLEKTESWTVPYDEGDYDVVVNAYTHKAFSKGGGQFAEKGCSGNPFSSERGFVLMSDCGQGSRKVVQVRKDLSQCTLLTDSISSSIATELDQTPRDVTCQMRQRDQAKSSLQLGYLECSLR